jgi:kynurenine/2-aminoadipate aminotransferase
MLICFLPGLCEWSVPQGGLFLWMRAANITDTWDMLMQKGLKKNVMVVPGEEISKKKLNCQIF